jgi:hypothetical protein
VIDDVRRRGVDDRSENRGDQQYQYEDSAGYGRMFAQEPPERAHLGVPDPWIDVRVRDVGEQITGDDEHGGQHGDRHQRRVVAREDR